MYAYRFCYLLHFQASVVFRTEPLESCAIYLYFCFLLLFSTSSHSSQFTFSLFSFFLYFTHISYICKSCFSYRLHSHCVKLAKRSWCCILPHSLGFFLFLPLCSYSHPLGLPSLCYQKLSVVNRISQTSNLFLMNWPLFPSGSPTVWAGGAGALIHSPGSHLHKKQSTSFVVTASTDCFTSSWRLINITCRINFMWAQACG